MIRNFNEYAIKNNEPHPIANLFYEAMLAVEKLGASEKQTDAIIKLGACKDAVEDLLFRNYKSGKVDVLLDGYIQSKDSPKAFIKGGDEVTIIKIKSKEEKLWDYLVKTLRPLKDNNRTAKKIYHRIESLKYLNHEIKNRRKI